MLWHPPIWSGAVASSWRRHALYACGAAGAEAGIGVWLRQIPTLSTTTGQLVWVWIGGLAGWLGLRVVLSWRRDLARESVALEAGRDFHRALWESAIHPPSRSEHGWLAREGRDWIESGTRAAAEMRTAIVTMSVLVPLLLWFAPWLALAVVLCGLALGWVAQLRSRAGKTIAEQDGALSRIETEAEEWAWRSMPEATASGIGQNVSDSAKQRHAGYSRDRMLRIRSTIAGSALGESAAHLGGWLLAAISLAAWKLGWLEAGNLAGFLGVALLAYRPVREAGRLLPQMQKAQKVWERWSSLADMREPRPVAGASLEVAGLWAGWDPDFPILTDIAFHALPGDILVAEGANGCGKSTLLAALAGNCPHGSRSLSLPDRRRWMAQEPVLPPIAPAEWIPDRSLVARRLLFPNGFPDNLDWDAPLPKGGQDLSRGQRARLALLATASDPGGLWLLDEPCSAFPWDERRALLTGLLALRADAVVILAEPKVPSGLIVESIVWQSLQDTGLRIVKVRPE